MDTGIGFWSRFCSERGFVGGWIWMIVRCFVDVHWPDCRVEFHGMDLLRRKHERGFSSFCHYVSAKTAEGLDYPSKFSRSVFNCTQSLHARSRVLQVVSGLDVWSCLDVLSRGLYQPPVDLRNQRPMSLDSLSYKQQKSSFQCWELRSEEYVGVVFQAGGV